MAGLLAFLGTMPTRLIAVLPVAILALAVSLSIAGRPMRALLIGALSLMLIFEAIVGAGTLMKIHSEYSLRDPERFASLAKSLPTSARIAADSQLWYTFMRSRRTFRMISGGNKLDRQYWNETPERFKAFQVIIFDEQSMSVFKFIPSGVIREMSTGSGSFVLIDRAGIVK
jgi:hypothetical protein